MLKITIKKSDEIIAENAIIGDLYKINGPAFLIAINIAQSKYVKAFVNLQSGELIYLDIRESVIRINEAELIIR